MKKGRNRRLHLLGLGACICVGIGNGYVLGNAYDDYSYIYLTTALVIINFYIAMFIAAWLKGTLDEGTIDE